MYDDPAVIRALTILLAVAIATQPVLAMGPGCCCVGPETPALASEAEPAPACCNLTAGLAEPDEPTRDRVPASPGSCDCPDACCVSIQKPTLGAFPAITLVARPAAHTQLVAARSEAPRAPTIAGPKRPPRSIVHA